MALIFFLVVLAFIAYRATTPEEHRRMADAAKAAAQHGLQWYLKRSPVEDEFDAALRGRLKLAIATLVILLLNAAMFVVTSSGRGMSPDGQGLLPWGASFGPRTSNGQWWRLISSLFIEPGLLALVIHAVCLHAVGRIVERLVGLRAFIATYITAGVLAGLSNMALQPIAIATGSAGAILGLFGVMAGNWGRGALGPAALAVPSAVIIRIGPLALLLFLQTVLSGELTASSALIAFITGAGAGLALTREPEAPPSRRAAFLLAAGWAVVAVLAVSLHSITDVRPIIAGLGPLEARTVATYEAVRKRFQSGRATPAALVETIEGSILPELRAEQTRIGALERVPREHQGLVRDAAEYLRHRTRSWELRAEGLRAMSGPPKRAAKTAKAARVEPPPVETRAEGQARHAANLMTMGRAETEERAALEMLQRLTTTTTAS